MAWITLTESDVSEALNNSELETYRAKVAEWESDPLPGVITQVTNLIRGIIAAKYTLPAAGLPPELEAAALDIIVYRLAKRCHADITAQRKAANDEAHELLKMLARGELAITDDAGNVMTSNDTPAIEEPDRLFTRTTEDGL